MTFGWCSINYMLINPTTKNHGTSICLKVSTGHSFTSMPDKQLTPSSNANHLGATMDTNLNYVQQLVREAEVILPTFSRDKSILLLNCPLHA